MSQLTKTTDHIKIDRYFVLLQINYKINLKHELFEVRSFTIGKNNIKRKCTTVEYSTLFIHFKIFKCHYVFETKLKIEKF